ncbi:MAG: nicotinate-nucleotide adenylyltransferase [Dehalococcoidia bacterium]
MRIGVLGGTFDPVHIAHLVIAEHAREQLSLDGVLFIPAGEPWRKSEREITPAKHRLAMLRIAIAGNDAFGVSDIELRRSGPTYTADTLAKLAGDRLDDGFWFIVGADALADLPQWHEPARIVQHARLAVAPRDVQDANIVAQGVPEFRDRIDFFRAPRMELSSTDIRGRVAAGQSIRYLVPDGVAAYIAQQRLYA